MNLTKKKIVYLVTLCLLAVVIVMALGVEIGRAHV